MALNRSISGSLVSWQQMMEQDVAAMSTLTSVHFLCLPRPLTFQDERIRFLIIGRDQVNIGGSRKKKQHDCTVENIKGEREKRRRIRKREDIEGYNCYHDIA